MPELTLEQKRAIARAKAKARLQQSTTVEQPVVEQPAQDVGGGSRYAALGNAYNAVASEISGGFSGVWNAVRRGLATGEQADVLNVTKTPETPEDFQALAQSQKDIQSFQPSKEYTAWQNSSSTGEFFSRLAKDPVQLLSEVMAESIASSATRMATGAATGAAVGTAVAPGPGTVAGLGYGVIAGMADASLMTEYSSKILQSLQEAGVDTTNPKALADAFANPVFMDQVKSKALKKAVPIAVFDLVSGGVAGNLWKQPAKRVLGKIGQGTGEVAIQAGLGGGGEALGEYASGEEFNPNAVLTEMVAEVGSTPIEVTFNTLNGADKTTEALPAEIKTEIDAETQSAANSINNAQTIRSNEGQVSETRTPSQESQGESSSNLQQQPQESSNTQNQVTNEKAQEETRIKEGGENGNENVSQNVQNEGEKGGQNVNQPQKPVGNLQLSVSDVIEQGIDVETENGIKGKLKVDQGGKITLRDRNYTVDLGNLAEVGGNPFESLGLKPATVKEQPFGGEMAPQRTVNEELKSQWKIVANAMTKGVRKGKALISEQLTKVQEMSKQSGMTPRQISAILTRIKNYNPFSGDSGVKLSAFIDKVASDSEYANKVSEARKLQRAIRGNKKNRTKLTVPEQKTFSAFAFIDPTEVDVDEYLKNAQALSSSVKSVRTGEKFQPAPIAEINNYAKNLITETYKKEIGNKLPESTEQMIREIQQNRAEQNLRNRLKKEGGEGFEEEIGIMLDNDLIGQRLEKSTKKDEAEKQLRALANATQKDLPNKAPDIIDLEGENYSQDQANEVFDTMKKIDLSLLNPEQLKAYTKAASKIATNGDYGGAGQIAVIAKKQEDFKTLVDKAKNFKIIKIGNAQIKLSSLPMLSQAIFGLSKDASAFQLYMGMTGISDANDTATQVERVLIDKLEKLQSKLPKAFTNDSLFRRGVYKTLVEYNKNENPTEALAKNKELLERDILTYTARGDKDSALTLERLFKPFRNLNTIEGVKAKMKEVDPDGLKVFEALVDTYKPYAQKIKDYNYFYWNRNAPEIVNYAGKRQYLKLAQTMKYGFEIDQEELEKLMSPSDFSRIGKPKETASAHSRKASVRKDENGNILPEENFKVINLNADGSSVSGLKSTAFEIEALPHMLQVEYNKNDPALKTEIFGYKLGDANAIEQADRIYDAMFADKIGTYSSFVGTSLGKVDGNRYQFDKKIQSFLNTMREVGYTATLGGVSQVAKQSTVLANTATQLGKNATFLFNSVGDMFTQKEATQNFLKGHSVASREQSQSILNIGENIDHRKLDQQVKAMVVNMSQGLPVQIYKKMVQYVGGLKFLTKTDATVAQASYLAFYRDYLDKNNVKFKGWEEEKALEKTPSRREAHAYAKQKVDVLQTASNPAEQAAAIKTGTLNAQIVKNLLIPYGTFALNQRLRLIGDYKAIRFGTIEQKKQAAKDIGSLMVETTVFKGLSWGTRAAMGYGIIALAQAMGAGGDEEDEFEKEQQSYLDKERFVGDLLATAVKDWTPSILLAPEQAQDALIWGINGGALATYNALAPEGEEMTLKEFEEEIGQILPLYQGRKDKAEEIADLIGVFGAPLSIGVDMTKMTSEYFKGEEYSDLTEDEKRYMGLVATMDFLAFLKVAPADIRFAMQREAKRIQRRRAGKQREPKGTYEFILGPKPE